MTTNRANESGRKWLWWAIPILLAGLAAGYLYSRPEGEGRSFKSFVGRWEGRFTWLDKTKSFPISVAFGEDGTYEFESVLRVSKGTFEIRGGTIQLIEEGKEGAAFTLGRENGKPVLLGRIEEVGTYRLVRVK